MLQEIQEGIITIVNYCKRFGLKTHRSCLTSCTILDKTFTVVFGTFK